MATKPPTSHSSVVLITGCSTGIGRAAAVRLARGGHTVVATARRLDAIADLADAGCHLLELDVTDEASRVAAVSTAAAEHGTVGVLVNNAGYSQTGPVEETGLDDLRRQFETNVFGLVRMCQLVLPGMRAQGWGRIVNLSSMGGKFTLPAGGAYHATKYAVEALSDALRFEVRPFGVAVSLVEPGPVATRFGETALATVPVTEGPYGTFKTEVAGTYERTYENPDARQTDPPEKVAAVIERAITASRPKARYPVGTMARSLMGAKRVLPDAGWDRVLRSQFPSPRA